MKAAQEKAKLRDEIGAVENRVRALEQEAGPREELIRALEMRIHSLNSHIEATEKESAGKLRLIEDLKRRCTESANAQDASNERVRLLSEQLADVSERLCMMMMMCDGV
jgi:ribosomal protein S15P/S13E